MHIHINEHMPCTRNVLQGDAHQKLMLYLLHYMYYVQMEPINRTTSVATSVATSAPFWFPM